MKRAFDTWFFASLVVMAMAIAMAATPPAGTVIRNQAAALVKGETYYSNVVETTVLPVCSLSLTPDGSAASPAQTVNVTPAGTAYLAYTITNTGNDTFTFDLSTVIDSASGWSPQSAKLYLDTNRNAQVDPGETEIQQIALDAGDSAWLILEVAAPAQGNGDLYISPSGSCPQGEQDADNYSLVRLVSGPALQLEKKLSPTQAHPGDLVSVELTVRNVGDSPAGDVVTVTDELTSLDGMVYEPGSASAPKGSIEFYDGSSWVQAEPADVQGIRLLLPDLDVGENAILSFDLRVATDADPGSRENHAEAEGPGGPAEAVATIEVLPNYELYLGPKGNPRALPGGEGSADDRQDANLIVEQAYCFSHTLENASSAADDFYLSASGLPDGVSGTFNVDPTVPLSVPVHLGAGEKIDFLYCVTAHELVDPFVVDLVARSAASGEANHTYDEAANVYPAGELVLTKQVDPTGTVSAGDELTYTLKFDNGYPVDVTNVWVYDWLDPNLEYISSSPEAEYDAARHRLLWRLDSVAAGEGWQAEVRVRVKQDTPDDTLIKNEFTLQADQTPNTLVSNTTETPVWSTNLLLQKQVTPEQAKLGDRLHYVLKVSNPSTAELTVKVTDTPPEYLAYIPGSATPSEPVVDEKGHLLWENVTIPAGGMATFEYDMRVLPGATKELVNVAVAEGVSASGAAVASSQATASVLASEDVFLAKRSTIVGRVYLDVNRDDHYDAGTDVPLPGARLLLPDGRQVLTDASGNFAFRDLEGGVWLIALDPATAPFPPRPHPEAIGDGYQHRVAAWGLTVTDFPLEGPVGVINAIRETTLFMGPLKIEKRVIPLSEDTYRVVLHLSTTEPLPDLTLQDPLPGGGKKEYHFDLLEGEKTITYELQGRPQLTDPEVRWRYP